MKRRATWLLLIVGLTATGCEPGLDTTYGLARGRSLNGTSTLAELFRRRGDTVRVARRLDEELGAWADTVIRFSPYSGPPDFREGAWYLNWLEESPRNRLLYVPRDYEAGVEYWTSVTDRLPATATEERSRARTEWRAGADRGGTPRKTALDRFAPRFGGLVRAGGRSGPAEGRAKAGRTLGVGDRRPTGRDPVAGPAGTGRWGPLAGAALG